MFTPIYKPTQLITGDGNIAVVTGWTDKKIVASKLNKSEYAVIGQLYNPLRGISLLIRNLLANPAVGAIVILNATREDKNAGGCQCLFDFFSNGFEIGKTDTGNDCWVIKSKIKGWIDIEIDKTALDSIKNIQVSFVDSISNAVNDVKIFSERIVFKEWRQSLTFPMKEALPLTLPGEIYGNRVEGKTIAETWIKIIQLIKTTGVLRPTGYGGQWQELIDLISVVTDEPDDFYFPDPNYLPASPESLRDYLPIILEDSEKKEGIKYTYGQRMRSWFGVDQVEQVIQKLIGEIDAASAVISLWDVNDHNTGGSPCLNHIWLRVVDNKLSMTATFRSNDMFSAWPLNAMGLRSLQRHICKAIAERSQYKVIMGPLITISQSAHLYDDCWLNAEDTIKKYYTTKRTYSDPVGNFIIEIVDGAIKVTRTTIDGAVVREYCDRNPEKLLDFIIGDAPNIQPRHSAYLGIELQKAYLLKTNYVQDR